MYIHYPAAFFTIIQCHKIILHSFHIFHVTIAQGICPHFHYGKVSTPYSTIFQTFDNNIDNISSKWGIFGKSFQEISSAIIGRISDINKGFQSTGSLADAFNSSDTIWQRLSSNKGQDQLIDIDARYPEINEKDYDFWLNSLKNIDKQVQEGTSSWQKYYDKLDESQKWIAIRGQETSGQIRTQEGLIKANKAARASVLAQNEAIKAQTLSARVGTAALSALSAAGNMLAFALISKGIEAATTAVSNWIHRVEIANGEMQDAVSEYDSARSSLESISSELEEHNAKIHELQSKGRLTYAEKGQFGVRI